MSGTTAPDGAVERLQEELRGNVLEPGEEGYDEARQVWNAMVDHRPDVVELSVKGGGHHVSGAAVPEHRRRRADARRRRRLA